MALTQIKFAPGVDKQDTSVGAIGRWTDSDNVRWRYGLPEKVGGWQKLGTNTFLGVARALHSFISLEGTRFLGLGTPFKYYIEEGDAYNDITPIRSTTSVIFQR